GKFVLACEPGAMNVKWTSPQTDDIQVTCEAYDTPQVSYGFPNANTPQATWTETVSALAGVEYTSSWTWALADANTYYVYCNLENTADQVTTFQTLLHVNSAAAGTCTTGSDGVVGYASPEPGELGAFDLVSNWMSDGITIDMAPLVIDLPGTTAVEDAGDWTLLVDADPVTSVAGTIVGS